MATGGGPAIHAVALRMESTIWRMRRLGRLAVLCAATAVALAACSAEPEPRRQVSLALTDAGSGPVEAAHSQVALLPVIAAPKNLGVFKVGKPYQVAGRWYYPKHDPDYDETGIASWYGSDFHGRHTANGEKYNMQALTGAHPTLPLPSYVSVTNLANNRTIVVRVNDRGPYKRGRIVDLSSKAASLLGYQSNGTARVRVRYVGKAPLNGDDSYETSYLAKQAWYRGSLQAAGDSGRATTDVTGTTEPLADDTSWAVAEVSFATEAEAATDWPATADSDAASAPAEQIQTTVLRVK